jgi:subtilisin family serine protease
MSATLNRTGLLKSVISLLMVLAIEVVVAAGCTEREPGKVTEPQYTLSLPQLSRDSVAEWIVVLNDSVKDVPAAVAEIANQHSVRVKYVWHTLIKGFSGNLPAAAVQALSRDPRVKVVEANAAVALATTQSSPPIGLDRIDQRQLPLDNAYNYFFNGSGVTVYVVDSGVRTTHTQFGGRASTGFTFNGSATDNCSHGTLVASVIGGADYGVAKSANLVSVKVKDGSAFGNCMQGRADDLVNGLNWIRDHGNGGSIVNISLTSYGGTTAVDDAARNLVNLGFDVIVSAGDSAMYPACNNSPARVSSVTTVASVNDNGSFQTAYSAGSCVKILAPGGYTIGANNTNDTQPFAVTIGASSVAAAYVSGVAALIKQQQPSTLPSGIAIGSATLNVVTGVPSGTPNRFLYSLHPYAEGTAPPEILTAAGNYTWTTRGVGGTGSYSYKWEYSDDNVNWTTVGTSSSYTAYVAEGNGDYPFWIRATSTIDGETFVSTTHHDVCTIGLGACTFQ